MFIDYDSIYIDFIVQDLALFGQVILGQTDTDKENSTLIDPLFGLTLIMIGGVTIVYFLFFYSAPSARSSYQTSTKPEIPTPIDSPPLAKIQETTQLIIAVSVNYPDIINVLQSRNQLKQEEWEQVYEACQYLYQSSIDTFFSKWESINAHFKVQTFSEYDVYLIKIGFNEKDDRFNQNVNQLDRYDAFRDLTTLAQKIQISERLKIEVYNEFDFYSR